MKNQFYLFLFVSFVCIISCEEGKPLSNSQEFTELEDLSIAQVSQSSIALADFNGDNYLDILITGVRGFFPDEESVSRVYFNNQDGSFSTPDTSPLEGVGDGSVAVADVDNDGDQDILITGVSNQNTRVSSLYLNDGSGDFTEVSTPFQRLARPSVAFADIDNDGDQDVMMIGEAGGFYTTKLYSNNGIGGFTEVLNTPFENVAEGSVSFADIDGDNDQDVLITGATYSSQATTKLYKNDGSGIFIEVENTPFETFWYGDAAFADVDGDNDQDVVITGFIDTNIAVNRQTYSKLYVNDGSGIFEEVNDTPFGGVSAIDIAFADVDLDGDNDLFIPGSGLSPNGGLYINDGSGNFTENRQAGLRGVRDGSIAFGDLDNDGDQDVVITGLSFDGGTTLVYLYQ
jgi:hypothetical protein